MINEKEDCTQDAASHIRDDGDAECFDIDMNDYEDYDDCDYTLTPEKSTFNISMKELDRNWTSLKYQLRSQFDSYDPKTKQRIVRKAMQAIDNVLYTIAPGQIDELKRECFEQEDREKEEKDLLSCLSSAIMDAPGRNTKIQLLSVVCKKDPDGNYLYKQNELLEKFQGITLYDVKQARRHASNDKAGMPVEVDEYVQKN